MPKSEFALCIRIRLGAGLIDDAIICPKCEKMILKPNCAHAFCCALAESTKGHYKIRDIIFDLCCLADSSADTEAPELIPSAPTLRPADIFTRAAVSGCQAALDVGIMSPDAAGAGSDCCEAMRKKKLKDYGPFLKELGDRGIRYIPLAFSTFGRIHAEAFTILEHICIKAARHRGLHDHQLLWRRFQVNLGVAIWRRAAAMVQSCLPVLTESALDLLFGRDDDIVDEEDISASAGIVCADGLAGLAA